MEGDLGAGNYCTLFNMGEFKTILFVDDDKNLADMTGSILLVLGYSPVVACNSAQALQIIIENEIDLAILDQNLGDNITGDELAQKLKLIKPDLKIMATSGNLSTETETNPCYCGFIRKPFSIDELKHLLETTFI